MKSAITSFQLIFIFLLQLTVVQLFNAIESNASSSLTIGLIPEKNKTDQLRRYRHIASYIFNKAGINIRLIFVPYDKLGNYVKEGKVDAAFFGSYGYILCRKEYGVIPIARPVWLNNSSTYCGYLFVRKDSGIKTIGDMEGKKLVMVSKTTTAGYLYPKSFFAKSGISTIEDFFSKILYAGSHQDAVWAVFSGEADVGAAKNHMFNELRADNPRIDKEMIVLAKSMDVPSNVLAVSPSVEREIWQEIQRLLQNMHKDSLGVEKLKLFGAKKFIATKDADYKNCYKLAYEAGVSY